MTLIRQSPDLYLAAGPICTIGAEDVALIKAAAMESPKGRARIIAHPSVDDALHEMVIALRSDSYIRPHKHPGKSEAFHLIEGAVDVVVFDDCGEIREVVRLAAGNGSGAFYYRMSTPFFHTLLIRSNILVVHEITNGPFVPGGAVFAAFAPEEGNGAAASRYLDQLDRRVRAAAGTL
jgi:cupin fold WbuC family metalloprotein